jgi:hypothetical protein
MAASAAQGASGQDDDPVQRPDVPGGDPLPDEMASWRPGDPVEYWEPVITRPDPMSEEEREAWLDAVAGQGEPFDPEVWYDPDGPPPPGEDALTLEELAGITEAVEGQARAAAVAARLGTTGALAVLAASPGRRGPGQPGSAGVFPGESSSRAAAFGSGLALDVAPGCPELAGLADEAAGDDDGYAGASDDELLGVLCAWERVEAHAWARKIAAIAELIRRRPAADCAPEGGQQMPAAFEEFAVEELALVLAESRGQARDLLTVALELHRKLPGTRAALRDGVISRDKAWAIACATGLLDPAEARAAEQMVLGRAGRLTPGGLRSAIARAVIEVAPDKARNRREAAARDARVQRWAEDSGNAALMGRELPPAEVLAADQRITAWARELRAAGLDGDMDELRARAYLDLLLGVDSRPGPPAGTSQDSKPGTGDGGKDEPGTGGPEGGEPGPAGPDRPGGPGGTGGTAAAPGGLRAGVIPAGFAGRITLTIPLATLLGLADRPGEIPGLGPVDPWLARDLARAAAQNPKTTWCATVTDEQGHAIGHGCARPGPKNHRKRDKPGPPGGHDPPGRTGNGDGAGFGFTAAGRDGPPGGYGAWTLSTGTAGRPGLLVTLDPVTTENCDHRFQAKGHDPGVRLRHLAQVRHATCASPTCRRPAATCDFEHNIAYEAGGRTCLCNGGPKCRRDHRLKQDPRWKVEQLPDSTIRWTTPSGRQYTTEPTCYPI